MAQQRKTEYYKFNIRHKEVQINKTTVIVFTMIIMTELYYKLLHQYITIATKKIKFPFPQ